MPDFHVIENVSETLIDLVSKALLVLTPVSATAPIAILHDLHSKPTPPEERAGVVAITLVETREDPASRNRPRGTDSKTGRSVSKKPPMALVLRYLLTPWAKDHELSTPEDRFLEQRMLGRVLQVLYDDAILSGNDLKGDGDPGLGGSSESLKVTLAPLTFEEQTRFWHAVQQQYRPSLTYDIRVVNLEPVVEVSEALVSSREIRYGVLTKP